MSLLKARASFRGKNYSEAIRYCGIYCDGESPPSLLTAAASLCKEALTYLEQEHRPSVIYTHSLDLEGAPLALLSLIEGGYFKSDHILVLATKHGPLEEFIPKTGSTLILGPATLDSEVSSPSQLDKAIFRVAIFLASISLGSLFINTSRGYLLAAASRYLGISYSWWIHEAEAPFAYINSEPVRDFAVKELEWCQNLYFASQTTLLKYRLDQSNSLKRAQVMEPRFVRSSLRLAKTRLDRRVSSEKIGLKRDEYFILSVGTICRRKNQLELLDALSSFCSLLKRRVRVYFLGSSLPEPEYTKTILAGIESIHKISNLIRIEIVQPTDHIAEYYVSADLFVHTSKAECYCQAVMEANYFELPIITRDSDGMTTILADREDAIIYTTAEELAKALESAIVHAVL